MTESLKFECRIENSDPTCQLELQIWLDDQMIYQNPWVKQSELVEHEFSDSEGDHQLRWIMLGKTTQHTQIDSEGNILKDAVINVSDVAFDGIQLGHCFTELATYQHNFNGNGQDITESFHNCMGCNGTVSMKFTTPVYLWLLENM